MTPEEGKLQASYLPRSFGKAVWVKNGGGYISTVLPMGSSMGRHASTMADVGESPRPVEEATRPEWIRPEKMRAYQTFQLGTDPVYQRADPASHTMRYTMAAPAGLKRRFRIIPTEKLGKLSLDEMRICLALLNCAPEIETKLGKESITFTLPRTLIPALFQLCRANEKDQDFHLRWDLPKSPPGILPVEVQSEMIGYNGLHTNVAHTYQVAIAQNSRRTPEITVTMPTQAIKDVFGTHARDTFRALRQTALSV